MCIRDRGGSLSSLSAKTETWYKGIYLFYKDGDSSKKHFGSLSENSIEVKGVFGEILLERYFKNDWQFMYKRRGGLEASILTANCMNMPSEFDEIFEQINSYHSDGLTE